MIIRKKDIFFRSIFFFHDTGKKEERMDQVNKQNLKNLVELELEKRKIILFFLLL